MVPPLIMHWQLFLWILPSSADLMSEIYFNSVPVSPIQFCDAKRKAAKLGMKWDRTKWRAGFSRNDFFFFLPSSFLLLNSELWPSIKQVTPTILQVLFCVLVWPRGWVCQCTLGVAGYSKSIIGVAGYSNNRVASYSIVRGPRLQTLWDLRWGTKRRLTRLEAGY